MSLFEEIQAVICEQLKAKPEDITLKTSFINDLGADSLDTIELIMALEDRFGIEIPDEDAEKMQTVSKLVNYIEKNKLTKQLNDGGKKGGW